MGELILCNQNMAAFPYYVEEAAIGVYSLEELSYYICHNVYLLRSDFMNEDLCNWLERELKLKDAADALREIVRKGGTLSEFVTCLLSQSGYCDRMQIAQIAQQIAELEHKSEYECSKIRADRYVTNGRYAAAIAAYRTLLANQAAENPILVGNVWHNLGKAYTGLFPVSGSSGTVTGRRTDSMRIPNLSANVSMRTGVCTMMTDSRIRRRNAA